MPGEGETSVDFSRDQDQDRRDRKGSQAEGAVWKKPRRAGTVWYMLGGSWVFLEFGMRQGHVGNETGQISREQLTHALLRSLNLICGQ